MTTVYCIPERLVMSGPIQVGNPSRPTWIHQVQIRDPEYPDRIWTVFTGSAIEVDRVLRILRDSPEKRQQSLTLAILRRQARRQAAKADAARRLASARKKFQKKS